MYDDTTNLFLAVVATAEAKGLLKQQVTLTPLSSMEPLPRRVELRGFWVDDHETICAIVAEHSQSYGCELVHYCRIEELGLARH